MSTKHRNKTARNVLTPLAVLGGMQKVGSDTADEVRMIVMCHLDAAKRNQGSTDGAQVLSTNLVIAQCIAAWTQSRAFYDRTARAILQLGKACARGTENLSFTTGEYLDIRDALSWYVRALPHVGCAMFASAAARANEVLIEIPNAA